MKHFLLILIVVAVGCYMPPPSTNVERETTIVVPERGPVVGPPVIVRPPIIVSPPHRHPPHHRPSSGLDINIDINKQHSQPNVDIDINKRSGGSNIDIDIKKK